MVIDDFNSNYFKPFLDKVNKEKKNIVLLGDFNINLLNCDSLNSHSNFVETLGSYQLLPCITLPTRITKPSSTLIDNIFTSPAPSPSISRNIEIGISDHLPQFCIFPDLNIKKIMENGPFFKQDWSRFQKENFLEELRQF